MKMQCSRKKRRWNTEQVNVEKVQSSYEYIEDVQEVITQMQDSVIGMFLQD